MLLIPARHLVVTDKWILNTTTLLEYMLQTFLLVFLSQTAGANLLLELNVNFSLLVTVMSYWHLCLLNSIDPVFCNC